MRTLLSWRNWIDAPGTTIAADSELLGLGVANITTPQIAEPWRATYAGAARNLRIDLGTAREIGAIALAFPRDGVQPQQQDRIRIRLSNTVVDGTEVLDTTAISADAGTYGMWVYPVTAGVRPNLVWNPSLRDSTAGWGVGGTNPPTFFGSATTVTALRDVGGFYAGRPGSTLLAGATMDVFFLGIPTAPGSVMEAQIRLASTSCSVQPVLQFYNAASGYLGEMAGLNVQQRSGQWKVHPSEWTRVTLRATAPANAATCVLIARGNTSLTVADPGIHDAEAAVYVADPSGMTPVFSGHYVGLERNVISLEAVAYARYATNSITSANPYLDIGRAWIGPALVPVYPPQSDGREVVDPGENIRAAHTGLRFGTPGVAMRSFQVTTPLLGADETACADAAVAWARGTRQVLAVREVLRANATAMFGSLTTLPAPRRILPRFSAMTYTVQEDF